MKGFELFYSGIVRHLSSKERKNGDGTKQWIEHILTMEHKSQDGPPVLTTFKLSKTAVKRGHFDTLKNLIGKEIKFISYIQNRVYNGKLYEDYYFTDIAI